MEAEEGKYYEVFFYDPVRLWQSYKEEIENNGKPCFTEYAAIVLLPDVTVEAVEKAVQFLWERDYFKYWKPDEAFHPT